MINIGEIKIIEVPADIEKAGISANIFTLALNLLPHYCAHRRGEVLSFEILVSIGNIWSENKGIVELADICHNCKLDCSRQN